MRICDICKKNNVAYDKYAIVAEDGSTKRLELCGRCYREFNHRRVLHEYQAYEETVKAMTGEIPRKVHWWNSIDWSKISEYF